MEASVDSGRMDWFISYRPIGCSVDVAGPAADGETLKAQDEEQSITYMMTSFEAVVIMT